jgi:hypothetical protein
MRFEDPLPLGILYEGKECSRRRRTLPQTDDEKITAKMIDFAPGWCYYYKNK